MDWQKSSVMKLILFDNDSVLLKTVAVKKIAGKNDNLLITTKQRHVQQRFFICFIFKMFVSNYTALLHYRLARTAH